MSSTNERKPLVVRRPAERMIDTGKVRMGDGWITSEFPRVRQPKKTMADSGKVRQGDGWITSTFPR